MTICFRAAVSAMDPDLRRDDDYYGEEPQSYIH